MTSDQRQRSPSYFVRALIAVVILGCALLLLRNLARVDFDQAIHSLTSIPLSRMIVIGMFVAGSYACLTFFDWLGLKYVGRPLPYRQAAPS